MALAGNHQHVAGGEIVQRRLDRLCPVADFRRSGHAVMIAARMRLGLRCADCRR